MSTTTNYYALTKPELSDPADIRAINGNMDTLDTILHGSQVSLADAFDQTKAYSAGDVVMYQFYMYKFTEDKAAGNWDATKVERTTAAETGGGEVDFDLFGEASGNPASFADGSESALVECDFDFEPKQDLHGYSKPWAPGAGKNKCPFIITDIKARNTDGTWTGNDYAINGVVVSVLTDTDGNITGFKFNGTANAAFSFNLTANNLTLLSGSYIWSIEETVDINNLWVSIYNPNAIAIVAKTQTEVNYTCNGSFGGAYIYTNSGNTFDNVVFQPMLRLSTESSGFEPYSNICPISGHSSVTINVSPTNDTSQGVDTTIQLGDTYYSGTLNAVTGELTIDRTFLQIGGDSTISWATQPSWTAGCWYNGTIMAGAKNISGYGTVANIISNMGEAQTPSDLANNIEFGVAHGNGTTLYVRVDNTLDTVEKFRTFLNNNNLQIVYELATPITVQIPPTVINTLLGQNYVSSEDTEDIDLVYTRSTAPIKPNPSNTPSGELRSIEIGGEIFEIIKELPTFPTSDGDYKLKLSVSSGVPTLNWESDT